MPPHVCPSSLIHIKFGWRARSYHGRELYLSVKMNISYSVFHEVVALEYKRIDFEVVYVSSAINFDYILF